MTMEFKIRTWLWITLVVVALIGGGTTYWYVAGNKSIKTATTTSPTPKKSATVSPTASSATTTISPIVSNLKTYINNIYGYSVKYPNDWTLKNNEKILSINSPDNQVLKDKIDVGKMYEEGYSPTVSIEYSPSVSDYVNSGNPQAKSTKTLYEYIQGQSINNDSLKEITLGGKKAYEYEAGGFAGTYYNIICEYNTKVYSITIPSDKKSLTDKEKAIISNFQFTQ